MAFPTTGILDNFNRGDEGPPPSSNWTDILNGLKVVGNEVKGNSTNQYNWSCWNVGTFGPDCEAYITMSDNMTNGGRGTCLRCTTLDSGTIDGYLSGWYAANDEELRIYRIDNGGFTQLGASVSWISDVGDKIGGEAIGGTIKCYVDDGGAGWAEKLSRDDATYGDAGYVGYRIFKHLEASDDFGGGTIGGEAGVTRMIPQIIFIQ